MPSLPRSRSAGVAVLGSLCFVLLLTGCGDGGTEPTPPRSTPPASPTAAAADQIIIRGFAFKPTSLKIRPGATITVVNQDSVPHTVTATEGEAFDTGEIAGGQSASFTAPDKPGTYPFFCSIHPYMKATLTVA
ncbi:cupredoxin family copper-binding protein [Streptomyces sp. P9(2023)]|uniref:cupredoxin domain-containing protein n=1 Tax=Streptomyces sp. P9(2023) TaxID=3064394 RepID=UPI0028F45CC9|nr:cupredoxin family copper-binding protein [Streptomyces sp. P9(2023)]MDT9691882.1 cupredoxin family copper-binding protein [Streptomyces sp. P9(2023)]